jgi:hypothetical protein
MCVLARSPMCMHGLFNSNSWKYIFKNNEVHINPAIRKIHPG